MISMLRCWSAQNLLDLYVDRRLSERQQSKVAAHLKSCAACRETLATMGPVPDVAKALARVTSPEGLAASIIKELGAEMTKAKALKGSMRPTQAAWRLSPAQAAAMLYLGLLTFGNGRGIPSQEEAPRGSERPSLPWREEVRK